MTATSADSAQFPRAIPVAATIGALGVVYGDIETNLGLRQFVVKGIRDSILDLGDGRVLIMDVEGNRYMVKDWPSLDDKSRRLLERVL